MFVTPWTRTGSSYSARINHQSFIGGFYLQISTVWVPLGCRHSYHSPCVHGLMSAHDLKRKGTNELSPLLIMLLYFPGEQPDVGWWIWSLTENMTKEKKKEEIKLGHKNKFEQGDNYHHRLSAIMQWFFLWAFPPSTDHFSWRIFKPPHLFCLNRVNSKTFSNEKKLLHCC